MHLFRPFLCLILLCPLVSHAEQQWYDYDRLYIQAGTYTHYTSSSEHSGPNVLISIEAVKSNDWLYGLALFDNSFGQFSQYAYLGKSWNYHGLFEGFYTKMTVGLIHGYRGEFKDKIPLNELGIAPAIIPSLGYKNGRYGADVIMLGLAGLLFTVGMEL